MGYPNMSVNMLPNDSIAQFTQNYDNSNAVALPHSLFQSMTPNDVQIYMQNRQANLINNGQNVAGIMNIPLQHNLIPGYNYFHMQPQDYTQQFFAMQQFAANNSNNQLLQVDVNELSKQSNSGTKSKRNNTSNSGVSNNRPKVLDPNSEPVEYDSKNRPLSYFCSECPKKFSMQSRLLQHMKCHNNQRPFKCLICGFAFTQKSYMVRHEAVHKDDRPFECGKCSKSYKHYGSLANHRKTHKNKNNQVDSVLKPDETQQQEQMLTYTVNNQDYSGQMTANLTHNAAQVYNQNIFPNNMNQFQNQLLKYNLVNAGNNAYQLNNNEQNQNDLSNNNNNPDNIIVKSESQNIIYDTSNDNNNNNTQIIYTSNGPIHQSVNTDNTAYITQ